MPKKGKGKRGRKGKGKKDEDLGPQYGSLFVETQIDPAKGGKVTGTRMSRTYELVVPEKGVDESVVIRMHVTSFDGYPPPSFRQNGRIVSNKVDLSPANLVLDKPCLLKIPHFAADKDGEKSMYIAALQQPSRVHARGADDETREGGDLMYEKLTANAQFNIGTGYATVWIHRLGTFYVCSSIADGIDYAVASYTIPAHVSGTTFNAVAFDWIEGECNLWTRTSLDRPPGKDGPVQVRRKARLTLDFDAKRIMSTAPQEAPTFPDTFVLSANNFNLFTGMIAAGTAHGTASAQAEPFDTIKYQVQVVPGSMMEVIEEKKAAVEQMMKDLKLAEVQALALGAELNADQKQPYFDRIQTAKKSLQDTRHVCLPWSESTDIHDSVAPSNLPTPHAEENPPEEADNLKDRLAADQTLSRPPVLQLPTVARPHFQPYKDLPAWEGKDLNIVFGAQMVPDTGFKEDHLVTQVSIVMASRNAEPRRLLEVPEMPAPGGRFAKVWVGPPKNKIFSFASVMTRASYAELVVNVRLGAWVHKCSITLSASDTSLADVRTIVNSHCYGRDLSEARFCLGNGQQAQVVDASKEHLIRAQTQRPSIYLWGNSQRAMIYSRNNIVLSFTSELSEWVTSLYSDLKIRGFPVWMDLRESGAAGIQGLDDAAMIICFLTLKYNESAHTCAEYASATQKNIPKIHIWAQPFETRSWLKTTIREQKAKADLGDARATHHELDIVKTAMDATMTAQQMDLIAIAAGRVLPAPSAPIHFLTRMPAPNSELPPRSVPEREEILKPLIALALDQHALATAATKKGKKGKGGDKKKK